MLKIYRKDADINEALLRVTLVNFLIILCWIVIFKVNRYWVYEIKEYFSALTLSERIGKNIIPGYSLFVDLKNNGFSISSDHFLNVLAFIPYGIILPFFYKKRKYLYTVLTFIGSTVFFETFQLITCIGQYDASDLLTNTLGGVIGILLFRYVFSKMRGNIVNIISSAVNLIATPFSVYAIVNTIIHFDYYL